MGARTLRSRLAAAKQQALTLLSMARSRQQKPCDRSLALLQPPVDEDVPHPHGSHIVENHRRVLIPTALQQIRKLACFLGENTLRLYACAPMHQEGGTGRGVKG